MKNLLIYVQNFMKKFAQPDSGQKKIEDVSMGEKKIIDRVWDRSPTYSQSRFNGSCIKTYGACIDMHAAARPRYTYDQLWH